MLVKINGELISFHRISTLENLKQIMKRPHICSSCGAVACVGGRNLKNASIKNAIKAKDGVYVLDCDNYTEDKTKSVNANNDERVLLSSPSECSIIHPNVRHVFIR